MTDCTPESGFRVFPGVTAQIRARRFDELDIRQPVDARDFEPAHQFLGVELVERTGAHRRVVPEDHALDAGDLPDPDDEAGANRVVGAPGRQRADLEKGTVAIERQGDAFSDRHLAALGEARHGLLTAAAFDLAQQAVDDLELLEHVATVFLELVGTSIDSRDERIHGRSKLLGRDDG